MYAHKPCPARCAKCKATAKASLNRLICQSGVNCERATAVNLLCGWCLWCHTDHVKYRLLFWFVLHVQESVKEIIRAGKTCITLKQMKAQRMLWEVKSLSGNQKKNKKCKCNNGVVDNSAVIDVFFLLLRGRRREVLKCFSPWCVNGWGGSFVVTNQGLKSTHVSSVYLLIHMWWDEESPAWLSGPFGLYTN